MSGTERVSRQASKSLLSTSPNCAHSTDTTATTAILRACPAAPAATAPTVAFS
eukprot:CAMPEP_0173188938 /NCGR_PEP_ID=MMETSP1141-20130122/11524_1 /TAXON_ID=483371 /ORGANISM="non described non described, Strain CCMP2298" /LENGTH=52 /DNA_ID=CAMNT_0014112905 /DNA_START=474 /DNA_END=629 /DNA_ORIENTATION=-